MTKFKFGDKVWHDEYGLCVVIGTHMYCGKSAYTIAHGNGYVKSCYMEEHLTKVTDWIPCSERMPDIDVEVLVLVGNFIYIDSLYYEKNLNEYWWQGNDRLPTHWMPLPNKL